jgi:hypothetical protein
MVKEGKVMRIQLGYIGKWSLGPTGMVEELEPGPGKLEQHTGNYIQTALFKASKANACFLLEDEQHGM